MIDMEVRLEREMKQLLNDFKEQLSIKPNQLLVIGCSTSEVIGSRIGSAGSLQVAEIIFQELKQFSKETGLSLAFQCCEHLNRALIIERETQDYFKFEEVTVVPIGNAGGSMAAHAYRSFNNPCVVEHIKADYGIDIGDTLIGMHLKHVAVPIRVSVKQIGEAHITLAKTRPKLIGGERAVYCV
jgi:uncharacterized protein (TIGR01440 family)